MIDWPVAEALKCCEYTRISVSRWFRNVLMHFGVNWIHVLSTKMVVMYLSLISTIGSCQQVIEFYLKSSFSELLRIGERRTWRWNFCHFLCGWFLLFGLLLVIFLLLFFLELASDWLSVLDSLASAVDSAFRCSTPSEAETWWLFGEVVLDPVHFFEDSSFFFSFLVDATSMVKIGVAVM